MPYLLNRYYPSRNILFFLGEGSLIFLSMVLSCLSFKGINPFMDDASLYISQALVVTVVFQLCLYYLDLYDLSEDLSIAETATRLTQAFGLGCIILAGLYYMLPRIIISTKIFWSAYVITCVVLLIYRFYYYKVLRQRLFVQGVVVIGTGKLANEISLEIEGRHDSVHKILAFVGGDKPGFNPNDVPVIEHLQDVTKELGLEKLERVIVAPDDRRGSTPLTTLLQYKMGGTRIEPGATFYERITGKIPVERIDPSWIIFSKGFILGRWRYLMKRLIDVMLSGFLLTITLPVTIISAIIIKLESPGPVFYKQKRVGQAGEEFWVIKFRSMCKDAEKNGAVWAEENDSRVTRFGSFIRRVRIDELPQLWNVLKGEMSLVGPRPERKVFINELIKEIPYYDIRHEVKPGVTGWAQVCYPYGASKEDALRKLEFDLYYVKHISIALDLLVIFHTVKTVLFGKGGR